MAERERSSTMRAPPSWSLRLRGSPPHPVLPEGPRVPSGRPASGCPREEHRAQEHRSSSLPTRQLWLVKFQEPRDDGLAARLHRAPRRGGGAPRGLRALENQGPRLPAFLPKWGPAGRPALLSGPPAGAPRAMGLRWRHVEHVETPEGTQPGSSLLSVTLKTKKTKKKMKETETGSCSCFV